MPTEVYNLNQGYDVCKNNFEELVNWYTENSGQRNEATTRVQLIDKIFFNCLGWSTDDVIAEEPHGKDYTDYTFFAPRRVLIVEAKKEGDYFELPAGKQSLEYSIQTLSRDYPNLKKALEQATRYCQIRGVPFGAICNGHQIVAYVATRNDGVPPLEGKALVFPSLNFMLKNFLKLWQLLSKPGIESKHIQIELIGDITPELPPKLSKSIAMYPSSKKRNIFQTDLQIVSELVFEDLAQLPELEKLFLEECYCRSGALSQFSLVSKTILQARYAALFESDIQVPTTVPATLKDRISPELIADSLSRRPILLIGDVGVGKTTFIRNLINVEATHLFQNAITLYIDLGSQAALTTDIRKFIVEEITRQLRTDHEVDIDSRNFVRGVYH